jgi:ABC-type siderophore export system fused ATPase/permease subunit
MDHHSSMTICHKANICYISHTMYLIFRVNINAVEYIIYVAEIKSYKTIISYLQQQSQTIVYLFKAYQNINYITKEWLTYIHVTSDQCHIQKKSTKEWTTHGSAITIDAVSFSHNISSTMLQGHHLHPKYLQPKEQYLHGRGVSHVRIGKKSEFTNSAI